MRIRGWDGVGGGGGGGRGGKKKCVKENREIGEEVKLRRHRR